MISIVSYVLFFLITIIPGFLLFSLIYTIFSIPLYSILNEKLDATTDKDGRIFFPRKRGWRQPLSTVFSEEYYIRYKDEDLNFSLSMPYYNDAPIIETEYGSENSVFKFKICADRLYEFINK